MDVHNIAKGGVFDHLVTSKNRFPIKIFKIHIHFIICDYFHFYLPNI